MKLLHTLIWDTIKYHQYIKINWTVKNCFKLKKTNPIHFKKENKKRDFIYFTTSTDIKSTKKKHPKIAVHFEVIQSYNVLSYILSISILNFVSSINHNEKIKIAWSAFVLFSSLPTIWIHWHRKWFLKNEWEASAYSVWI